MNPSAGRTGNQKDGEEEEEDAVIEVMRFDFVVQFSWQPKLPGEPDEKEQQEEQEVQEGEAQP